MFEDYHIVGGHLGLDEGGNFLGVEGSARVAQSVKVRLDTALGEWKFKIDIGVDWFGVVLIKDADLIIIRADLVGQIQDVDGLKRVTSLTLAVSADRVLNVQWKGITDDGIPVGGIV